jgi:predicted ABC-type ATPase
MAVFVGTASVEINIERVKARVKTGGHDVSEEDQRRRYPRTLANMKRLLHWPEPVPEWAAFIRG